MNLFDLPIPIIVGCGVLLLLAIGFYGLMVSRNLIRVIIALQILGKGAMLALVLSGAVNHRLEIAQAMALTTIIADTIVAVVGLAMVVQIRRKFGTLDITCLTNLRR